MDDSLKREISIGLDRTYQLLKSRILWADENLVFRRSVLIEVLIHLKDLTIKADRLNKRISFTDDIIPNGKYKVVDITDTIKFIRDALCHIDSDKHKPVPGITWGYGEIRGIGSGVKFGGILTPNSKYPDDILFIIGGYNLYLHRHIERTYNELEAIFRPLLND